MTDPIRAIHYEVDGSPDREGSCIADGEDFPCSTIEALAVYRAEVLNEAADLVYKQADPACHCGGCDSCIARDYAEKVYRLADSAPCRHCGKPADWVECPTGGWWSHAVHPEDGHDAAPGPQPETHVVDYDAADGAEPECVDDCPGCAPAPQPDAERIRAERDEVIIRWLLKKAAEYRATRSPQHALQAETIEMLADKIRRGAARPNNLRMPTTAPQPENPPERRRTKWATAQELQQAATTLRATAPDLPGRLSGLADPVADWLDETANALAWLAPYRPHEGGYGMWETATTVARAINGTDSGQARALKEG